MSGTPRTQRRPEPDVLFPVVYPAGSKPPTIAAWLFRGLERHVHYAQAVAEIARRNGGGGHMLVELKPNTWEHTHNGQRYTGAIAVARWNRSRLELSAGVERPDELRAGPTQKRFTAQVLVPNGTDTPDTATALVECRTFHADALRELEAQGWTDSVGVLVAMDGGGAK
jgi:hypothetical protein